MTSLNIYSGGKSTPVFFACIVESYRYSSKFPIDHNEKTWQHVHFTRMHCGHDQAETTAKEGAKQKA